MKNKLKSWPILGALGAITVAGLGLLGYLPGLGFLGSVNEDYIPMAPSTAISFVILGFILLDINVKHLTTTKLIYPLATISLVSLFGILEVAGYFSGIDLNFEDTLIPSAGELKGIPIARMSPATGATFFLSGIAAFLFILQRNFPNKNVLIEYFAGGLGILVLLISIVFCLAYFYGTPLLYGRGTTVPMALTTALGFLFLSISILTTEMESFPLKLLTATSTRSYLLRFILPLSLLTALLGGITHFFIVQISEINPAFILAVLTVLVIIISGFVTTALSDHLGNKIDRSKAALEQANEALQKSEERWHFALEGNREGVWDWNVVTNEVFFSNRWKEILGYEEGEIGNGLDEWEKRLHPDDKERVHADVNRHFDGETPFYQNEHRVLCKDGSYIWILDRGKIIAWTEDKKPQRMIGTSLDITERKQAEEKLNKVSRLYATLCQINQAIVREHDRQKLFQQICNIIIEFGQFRLAWIGLLDEEKQSVKPIAFSGECSDYLQDIEIPLGNDLTGKGPAARSIMEGKYVVFNDLRNDPDSLSWCTQIFEKNCLASATFPLRLNDSTIGTLNVCAAEYSYFDEDEIKLLEEMALDISFALDAFEEEKNRKLAEEKLQKSEEQLNRVIKGASLGYWDWNYQTGEQSVNERWLEILGLEWNDIKGDISDWQDRIHPDDQGMVESNFEQCLKSGGVYSVEFRMRHKDGHWVWIHGTGSVVEFDAKTGEPLRISGTHTDISELREKDAALNQAQKMEAVGQLTGGIAHDFNNLLSIISGNLRFLRQDVGETSQDIDELFEDAISAVNDGTELTQRLLGFSRNRILQTEIINVNDTIEKFVRFLSRILGENTDLETVLPDENLFISVDPSQLENALLNLSLNARDAMPKGGTITINATNYHGDGDGILPEGNYIKISIIDKGSGISPEDLQHVYEPFFTTKEVGKGSGIGLSMVYGFAQQSNGCCHIDSTLGEGTTVSLHFPEVMGDEIIDQKIVSKEELFSHVGPKVILVVEDERRVRKVTLRDLRKLGYQTLEAENADMARMIIESGEPIDLLFSDIIMPGEMDGHMLAKWTEENYPQIKIVLTSGYTKAKKEVMEDEEHQFPLIRKPYSIEKLTQLIRTTLGEKA